MRMKIKRVRNFYEVLTSLEDIASVHKEIERILLWKLYALANDITEVVSCQIVGNEVSATNKNGVSDCSTKIKLSDLQ